MSAGWTASSADGSLVPTPDAARPTGAADGPPLRAERARLREIRIPLHRPFEISSGTTSERRVLLLELVHPDGPRVWSECVAGEVPDYSAETADTAWWAITEWLAPVVLGRTFGGPGELAPVLDRVVRGHPMAKAAVEMGYWALHAALADRPLVDLLGGTRTRLPTGITLGLAESPTTVAERAVALRARGYAKIKLKVRRGDDLARLRLAREALGPDGPLAADANGAYGQADLLHLTRFDPLGLLALEQPFEGGDLRRHAGLQRRLRTPVCLDESVASLSSAEDMVALGSGRALNLKPGRVGGLGPSLAIHALCRREGLGLFCGGMLETGIGRAYNLALASLPGFDLPGDIYPPSDYLTCDVLRRPLTMDANGAVPVPRAVPGLGVEVDADAVDDLTVRRVVLPAGRVADGERIG